MIRRSPVNPAVVFLACLLSFGITGLIISFIWGAVRVSQGFATFSTPNILTWLYLIALPLFVLGGFVGLVASVALRLREDRMIGRTHRF